MLLCWSLGGIGRDVGHLADQLRCDPLVEGREADKSLLALPHLVDVVRLQLGLDLQIVGIRHHLHDGVAGANDAADGVRAQLMDHARRRRAHLDALEDVARRDASFAEFGFLALRLAEILDDFGAYILVEPDHLQLRLVDLGLGLGDGGDQLAALTLDSGGSRAAGP